MSTTQDDIFDAATYAGWRLHAADDDGVIFSHGYGDFWLTVMWSRTGTVRDAYLQRRVRPAPGQRHGRWETVEDIAGRNKAGRVLELLRDVADTPRIPTFTSPKK